jgi:tetratricopeptide (TPR) repeat protein
MQVPPARFRLRLLAFFLLLPLLALAQVRIPQPAYAQSSGEQPSLKTEYFTIFYPEGEEDAASWYASFADDVNVAVAEMLGENAVTGLTLRIYATEQEYIAANPAAEEHQGIMAHAIPEKLEIGVAVERLRQVEPAVARESFRHEMTHIVAGALSNQQLTIGFHEGLAQYNELSTRRAQESAQLLRNAQSSGVELMSWVALNNRDTFMQRPDLAYPEAYSVMAFLAERYGMGTFGQFVAGIRSGEPWQRVMSQVYGKRVSVLESEYRDQFLPEFLREGWKENVLTAYDLSPGLAYYEAGHFTEARDHFEKSEKLYRDLGRTERAEAAAAYLANAVKAGEAKTSAADARKSLEAYEYEAARDTAARAVAAFDELKLPSQSEIAGETRQLAERGVLAKAQLANARERLDRFDLPGARAEARAASEAFGELGDAQRAEQANKIVSDLSLYITSAGAGALALGLLAMGGGTLAVLRSRRRVPVHRVPVQEESTSWL